MKSIITNFDDELGDLRDLMASRQDRLVLVESCTAGIISGLLGQIPGISQFLCGSLVVYRNDSKRQWLGIDSSKLDDPNIGPVSKTVTEELAIAALQRTPEATIAGAITGHLGPDAPAAFEGRVFTCVHQRVSNVPAMAIGHRLTSPPPQNSLDWPARKCRQVEAARILIAELRKTLAARS